MKRYKLDKRHRKENDKEIFNRKTHKLFTVACMEILNLLRVVG